jgi:hypothetical protein
MERLSNIQVNVIFTYSYEVSFLSMVLPQDRLSTKLSHIGMINGKKIIKVETFNQNGSKVSYNFLFPYLNCLLSVPVGLSNTQTCCLLICAL